MSLRILIVEDDALTAAAFAAALRDAGHAVAAVADTSRAALAQVDQVEPELALIDIALRDGRTGLTLARALHNDGIGVVLVSGDPQLRAKAEAVCALGYVAKPADADAVTRVIGEIERRLAPPDATLVLEDYPTETRASAQVLEWPSARFTVG